MRRSRVSFDARTHLDHPSPAFGAVTAMRLTGTAEIRVVFLDVTTLRPRIERRRCELLGHEGVEGDVVVRSAGLYELEWYEAGASGPRPLG